MKDNYYILQNGTLKKKENTVHFVNKDIKRAIPVHKISSIYAYGQLTVTSGVINYLSKMGIPIHFFNYYGWYEGSFYPKEKLVSGDALIKQAEHYLDKEKKLYLAKQFVFAAAKNIEKNLKSHNLETEKIERLQEQIELQNNVQSLMGIEGNIRDEYYTLLDTMFSEEFQIQTRTKRPPKNMTNTLISFGNGCMYNTVLSEIYNCQLNPTISYLHSPSERRFSLSLDLAEIFKPIIVDRVIFKLVNKKMIDETYFDNKLNRILLNEKGKRLFLKQYEERLNSTIKHKKLKRNVSYKSLIRMECYKLLKHLMDIEEYKAFVMWW